MSKYPVCVMKKQIKNAYIKIHTLSNIQITESHNLRYLTILFILLFSCASCHGEDPPRTPSTEGEKKVYPSINPQTILIDDLTEEYRGKEVIFGTFDSKLYVLSLESMESPFDIPTKGNVKKIGVADITNDGKNELIIITERNILSIYDSNGNQIRDLTFQDNVTSFAFLDGNKDGVTDIILGTSTGITAIDINGQCVWSTPVEIPFVEDLIVEDIDKFAEKEIVGYTKNTVFILKYIGGNPTFVDFSPYEVTASSTYDASNEKYIIVASTEGRLSWIEYNGTKRDVQNFNMNVSKIIFSQTRIPNYTRNFLFVISDKEQAKAIDLSGKDIDNFGVYDNILNIESANLDKRETQYGNIDYDETILSGSDGRIVILIHYFKGKIEDRNEFGWLKIRDYESDFEKVVFSKLIEESPDHFILFQVSQEGEMQKYIIFSDTSWIFSMYDLAIYYYDLGDYKTAFYYLDTILSNSWYRELAEYYGFYQDCITKQDECQRNFEIEKAQAEQKLSEGMDKTDTDALGAVKDLSEAYKGFKRANFRENDVVDEEQNLTVKDVKEMILHLVFPLLEEADKENAEKNYEKALRLYSRIYPIYEEFSWYIEDLANETEDFEEYETLIEKYPDHWMILPIIDSCKENIEKDANDLFNEGKFKDAKDNYEIVRIALIDKGESEDSNAVKEIADKIVKCDMGIQKSRIEKCILFSFLWVLFMGAVFRTHKKKEFPEYSFQKYLIRIKERDMWKNERVFATSFLGGFASFLGFQRIVSPYYSILGSSSVFFLIFVIYVFIEFHLFYGKSQKEKDEFKGKWSDENVKFFEYDIAISFAGEDREIAKNLAEKLQSKLVNDRAVKVFYDDFYKSKLWGKKLTSFFQDIYGSKSRFVVVLISEYYPIKDWTDYEFSIMRQEAKKRRTEFILPVKLDNTKILGIHEDIAYLDYQREGIDSIVNCLIEKLSKHLDHL